MKQRPGQKVIMPEQCDRETRRVLNKFRKQLGKAVASDSASQASISRDIRMNPSHLSRLISGETDPGLDVIIRLSRRLSFGVELPDYSGK